MNARIFLRTRRRGAGATQLMILGSAVVSTDEAFTALGETVTVASVTVDPLDGAIVIRIHPTTARDVRAAAVGLTADPILTGGILDDPR